LCCPKPLKGLGAALRQFVLFNQIRTSVIPLFTSQLANGLGAAYIEAVYKQKNLV